MEDLRLFGSMTDPPRLPQKEFGPTMYTMLAGRFRAYPGAFSEGEILMVGQKLQSMDLLGREGKTATKDQCFRAFIRSLYA